MAVKAVNSGILVIGGGIVKHHICNANLMVYLLVISLIFVAIIFDHFYLKIIKFISYKKHQQDHKRFIFKFTIYLFRNKCVRVVKNILEI